MSFRQSLWSNDWVECDEWGWVVAHNKDHMRERETHHLLHLSKTWVPLITMSQWTSRGCSLQMPTWNLMGDSLLKSCERGKQNKLLVCSNWVTFKRQKGLNHEYSNLLFKYATWTYAVCAYLTGRCILWGLGFSKSLSLVFCYSW